MFELGNGTGDAFLHIGALQAAGYETVPPGAKLKVNVANGMKGAQVTRVLEVDTAGAAERAPQPRTFGDSPRPARRAPDPSTAVSVSGTVKWFDDNKGFGFVQSNDGGKDVFVHISILGPSGRAEPCRGTARQHAGRRYPEGPRGPVDCARIAFGKARQATRLADFSMTGPPPRPVMLLLRGGTRQAPVVRRFASLLRITRSAAKLNPACNLPPTFSV